MTVKRHRHRVLGCLWLLPLPFQGWCADVSYYGIVKSVQYQQTNDTAAFLAGTNACTFTAFVLGSTNNTIIGGTVQASNASTNHTLSPDTNAASCRFTDSFASQAALDTAYPINLGPLSPVNYTVTAFTVHDGTLSGTLNFYALYPLVTLSYPTTPLFTNLAAAQSIDTTRDFSLQWTNLGGSIAAIVELTVLDLASNAVFSSPLPFSTGALSGASTNVVIPAYTLPAGASLLAHLSIGNPGLPNTNGIPGANGVPALAKDTQISVVTRPAPARPHLDILPSPPSQFHLRLTGESNRLYQIQASPDALGWTNVFNTNCAAGVFDYSDTNLANPGARFYRGKVGQ
jgi:hypothetical protein